MLNQQSSLSEITQSIKHINEVFLPNIKQKLASKTYYGAENSFDVLINNIALDKLGGKRMASGIKRAEANTIYFANLFNDYSGYYYPLNVNGLGFIPSTVIAFNGDNGYLMVTANRHHVTGSGLVGYWSSVSPSDFLGLTGNAYINERGFQLPVNTNFSNVYWYAYE